jgi:benzoylformate decarboxylase
VIARGLGVEARVIEGYADLAAVLDEVLPSLADRTSPLVLEVVVAPDEAFAP